MTKALDVIVIGGGMVGISVAAMLPDNLKVAVIDSFPLPNEVNPSVFQPSFDGRSTALSAGSCKILSSYDLWPALSKVAEPIKKVHVSDKGRWGKTLLDSEAEKKEALGYVVENASLGKTLLEFVLKKPSVELICPGKVINVRVRCYGVDIEYQQEGKEETQHVRASLAIVADGAQSQICQKLGIDMTVVDYHHKAIVANIGTTLPHNHIAYERFTRHGPLALLPLSPINNQSRSSLIWTMPDALADELIQLQDKDFLEELQLCFGYRVGRFVQVGKRDVYPLKLSQSNEQVRQNVVVLGNAAHSLHPVAGQGFNLALRDIFALCVEIEKAYEQGTFIGDLSVLRSYYHRQKIDQKATIWFSDKLPSLFTTGKVPQMLLNNFGLASLDIIPPAKSRFIGFASGERNNSIYGASD